MIIVAWMTVLLAAKAIPDSPASEDIRKTMADVFARPEFVESDAPSPNSWKIPQWLSDLLTWLAQLYVVNYWLWLMIIVTVVTSLVGLLTYALWKLKAAFGSGNRVLVHSNQDGMTAQRLRQSAKCFDDALNWAARAEYTEAIRHLFLALIWRFDEAGRVGFQKSYTNREYLALIERPTVRDGLRVFVDRLDDHWYGQSASEASSYEECLRLYERLVKV